MRFTEHARKGKGSGEEGARKKVEGLRVSKKGDR